MVAPFVVDPHIRRAIEEAQLLALASRQGNTEAKLEKPVGTLRVKLLLPENELLGQAQVARATSAQESKEEEGKSAGGQVEGGHAKEKIELPGCWASLQTLRMISIYAGTAVKLETLREYEDSFLASPGASAVTTDKRYTFARIHAMDEVDVAKGSQSASEDGILYVSSEVAYHLGLHHDLVSELVLDKDVENFIGVSVQQVDEEDMVQEPSVQVTVAKVAVPITKNVLDFTALDQEVSLQNSEIQLTSLSLRDFFQKRRLVEYGQVLPVPYVSTIDAISNQVSACKKGNFFVKVIDVTPKQKEPILISAPECRIILQGTASSAIPPLMETDKRLTERVSSSGTVRALLPLIVPYFHCRLYRSSQMSILLHGPLGSNKSGCVRDIASSLGIHIVELNAFDLVQPTEEKTANVIKATFDKCKEFSPCILLLRKVHAFAKIPNVTEKDRLLNTCLLDYIKKGNVRERVFDKGVLEHSGIGREPKGNVMLVGTTESIDDLPMNLRTVFSHEVQYAASEEMIKESVNTVPGAQDFKIDNFEAVGLTQRDFNAVISKSYAMTMMEEREHASSASEVNLSKECFGVALKTTKDRIAKTLGAPKVPSVQWNDVGGLAEAKDTLISTIETPLKYPHLFSKDLRRRSGVLLYGPPGTGKTLLAKAVATEFQMNFLSVKGPELINMYVGESERNVREIFAKARSAAPCIVFFDELDSLAPARGSGGDSGGVMDRVVSQFLAELDGIQSDGKESIFIIGATNRPDLIDSALLRPGRFDCLQYIGISSSVENKQNVLQALTRKFLFHQDVDLKEIAGRCPDTYSGADLYALCTEAWLTAARDIIDSGGIKLAKGDVLVKRSDFLVSLTKIRPSLSAQEIQHYKQLQERFQTRK
jgi:peroxin-6